MTPDPSDDLERIQAARGFKRKWHTVVSRYDPGMLARHHESFEAVMGMPNLDRATKELIIVAVDCAQFWPGVKVHILSALRAGASEEQVAEAILTAGIPAGPHAVVYGMEALDAVLEDQRDGGTDGIPEY